MSKAQSFKSQGFCVNMTQTEVAKEINGGKLMRELKDFLAKGILNKMLFIVVGLILIVGLFYAGCFVVGMTLFAETSFGARKKTYSDIEKYTDYIGAEAVDNFSNKWGMDESIFPEKILDSMEVDNYNLTYYNPWDAEYVGYLTITYSDDEYEKELERLSQKEQDEYIGLFDVSSAPDGYTVLAMDSDSDWGLVYAITPDVNDTTITYVEVIFPGKLHMKLNKYLPQQYQLKDMDVS